MRSRYTAYATGNADYLFKTHHPSQRTFEERFELAKTIKKTRWLRLSVLQTQQGQPGNSSGVVEFMAVYADPEPSQLHERSNFVQQNGRWFYTDGESAFP